MNCLKNPRRNLRLVSAVNRYEEACNINVLCLSNLLESLRELYPKQFGRTGLRRYLDNFKEWVHYLKADDDSEVREYRMSGMLNDMPYISKRLADTILKALAMQASAKDRAVLSVPEYHEGLIENIVVMIATLHYDFGFGESRVKRVINKWREGKIGDGDKWLTENVDYVSDPVAERREMEDEILERKRHKLKVTVREQLDARKGLETLKKYQEAIKSE